jgi:hypothetical protein
MTRRDVDSLLSDWDEVARTARTPTPAMRTSRVTAQGLAGLPLMVVAALIVAGIAVLARPIGGPGGGSSPDASMAAVAPVTDSADDGTLRLVLTADRGTYAEGDPITAIATVEYLGPDARIDVFTLHSAVVFSLAEVGGDRSVAGGQRTSCVQRTLTRGVPETYPWAKSGGFDPADPGEDFVEWYLTSGPELRLPAGTWRLSVGFGGSEGGCGGLTHALTAEVTVRVEAATTVSPGPSSEAVTPPPGSPTVGPPAVTVTCGRIASVPCGGLLAILAADHADQLSAAVRIVVDDPCPPTADCDRTYPFEAMAVVIPPGGIDGAAVYLATGKDGPDDVAAHDGAIPYWIAAQVDAPGPAPEPIALLTDEPPRDPGETPAACPAALLEGRLVLDERWGPAVQGTGPESPIVRVVWPFGYTARVDALGIALVGADGVAIAHLGDVLAIGGGGHPAGGFGACGDVTRVDPDAP